MSECEKKVTIMKVGGEVAGHYHQSLDGNVGRRSSRVDALYLRTSIGITIGILTVAIVLGILAFPALYGSLLFRILEGLFSLHGRGGSVFGVMGVVLIIVALVKALVQGLAVAMLVSEGPAIDGGTGRWPVPVGGV
jgi:hypothetical protein